MILITCIVKFITAVTILKYSSGMTEAFRWLTILLIFSHNLCYDFSWPCLLFADEYIKL